MRAHVPAWCIAYLTVCSIASAEPVVLNFSGRVDGSGTATISALSAVWSNHYYSTPNALTLNGFAWNPWTQPALDASGSPLLPASLSGYRANVVRTSGRDSIAAEIVGDQLLVHVCDTPIGDDLYAFQVVLSEQPTPPPPTVELRLQGFFDGSDRIVIDNSGATLQHLHWSPPAALSLNGVAWNASSTPYLPNSGAGTFLPTPVLFGSGLFTKNAGRDLASYEIFEDRVEMIFADAPGGAGFYDVTLRFAAVPEPSSLVSGGMAFLMFTIAAFHRRSLLQKQQDL